jgi:polyhydroxyalkanoate synthase subunit PhaE
MTEQQNPFGEIAAFWTKICEGFGNKDEILGLSPKAFDPQRWLVPGWLSAEQPLEFLGGLPQFAFPMMDRKIIALMSGWLLLFQRHSEYNIKIMQAWNDAYAELCTELQNAAAKGETIHAGRELLDRMVTVFNGKIQAVQRSEDFLASQRKLLDAFLSSRTRERELIEIVINFFDLPTRTEMNDAHRSVHGLKREVRALQRELDRLKSEAARGSSASPPARLMGGRPKPAARSKGGGP